MKKNAVHLGQSYLAKVSGKIVRVRIDAESPYGGWDATNLGTGKKIRVKSAQRLRAEAKGTMRPVGPRNAPVAHVATEYGEGPQRYDPERCATPRCKGEPALTYLGKPLCQKCWDRQCAQEQPGDMVTEGAVPLAEALATSPIAAANEASWERAQPGPDDVGNDDEHEDADDESASTGDAGELDTDDMATKTKKRKGRKTTAKAPAGRKRKADAKALSSRKTKTVTNAEAQPKRVSALDAAAQVLRSAKEPMRSREIIEAAASKGLWTSPAGKTPHATLDAAMRREIKVKGKDARFTIEGRGLFGYAG